MPSDDSQVDALEHSVDVAAVQNSLAHMSMPQAAVKNARRPQANSPGLALCWAVTFNVEASCVLLLPAAVSWVVVQACGFLLKLCYKACMLSTRCDAICGTLSHVFMLLHIALIHGLDVMLMYAIITDCQTEK